MPPKAPHAVVALLLALTPGCTCEPPTDSATKPASRAKKASGPPTKGFITVRAGSFIMGSAPSEQARYTNEEKHKVTLTRDFEISPTEVTQAQFKALMGYNPSSFEGCDRCPVETVNWNEAVAYCNAMSKKAGLAACYSCRAKGPATKCDVAGGFRDAKIYDCPGYRLPTDAEWEYAYRAGTTTTYYNGDNDPESRVDCSAEEPVANAIGWYCQNSGSKSHEVGKKKPNAWGLFDMAGNVWEWCHDRYLAVLKRDVTDPWGINDSSMHVVRGGAWKYYSRGMRAACRAWYSPSYRGDRHGFRPARTR